MLKVTLINPTQPTKYPQPPMGIALIAAILVRAGYQVTVLDANALNLPPEAVAPMVSNADVVGLTAMTPTINAAIATARHLKQARPELPVILGGAHATLLPEETLAAAPEVDILVKGEGENTILEVLPALENNKPLHDIPGISYRAGDKIVSNPLHTELVDPDSLPFLAYHLLPMKRYKPHPPHGRALPFAAIITSRGCPYKCSYCSKPIFGARFRSQSPVRVVDEIAHLKQRFGIREFAFYDDVFTLNKKRAHAIADELIRRKLNIDWTCEARVGLVDTELLRHIRQAGCYSVSYGIESGSQEILNTLDKDITLEQAEQAVRTSQEVGLQTIGYFMVGSPGETPDTSRQTIQFAKKLKLDFAQFGITTPFPGTKLYDLYLNSGKGGDIPWESFAYTGGYKAAPVFDSELLSRDDIRRWTRRAYREFYLRPGYPWQRIRRTTSWGDVKVGIKGIAMLLENIRS